MMIEATSILLIGLALLVLGSNLLVTSTENFSGYFSISGFFASFFLIGIATSAPEIFISIQSALQEKTILAIGNGLGSNISNICLVFCISIFFIKNYSSNFSIPMIPLISMIILTLSFLILVYFDTFFGTVDSIILIIIFIISMFFFNHKEDQFENPKTNKNIYNITFLFLLGMLLLISGSNLFIDGATRIALYYSISAYVIGLTLTAIGTSLPELAASIQSASKGRSDFIVGNVIGSNIFNIAVAMTTAGLISSTNIYANEVFRDIIMIIFTTLVFYFIVKTNKAVIKTVYSIVLVITYILYIGFVAR